MTYLFDFSQGKTVTFMNDNQTNLSELKGARQTATLKNQVR